MSQTPESKSASMLARLKQKAKQHNTNYLTRDQVPQAASMQALNCPQCGAARVKDELRFCGHCRHEFLRDDVSAGGIYLQPKKN